MDRVIEDPLKELEAFCAASAEEQERWEDDRRAAIDRRWDELEANPLFGIF